MSEPQVCSYCYYIDYGEVLVHNYHQLTCENGASYVQLRRIVLSAFRNTSPLLDPFTRVLKVDRLTDNSETPIVKLPIDSYL